MRKPVYLVEKFTGLYDENGVELFYVFAARLTHGDAVEDFEDQINQGEVRVRKIYATKNPRT